jgi:hypothetical protein
LASASAAGINVFPPPCFGDEEDGVKRGDPPPIEYPRGGGAGKGALVFTADEGRSPAARKKSIASASNCTFGSTACEFIKEEDEEEEEEEEEEEMAP